MSAAAALDWEALQAGDERSFELEDVTRTHFVRYAGASGDFNPIHHDQTFAEAAGLPTVFGVGMWTAGVLSRVAVEWFGPSDGVARDIGTLLRLQLREDEARQHYEISQSRSVSRVRMNSGCSARTVS